MPKKLLDVILYSVPEFAELLGVVPATARRYIKLNNLPTQTIGGRLYLTDRQIRNFLRNKTEGKLS